MSAKAKETLFAAVQDLIAGTVRKFVRKNCPGGLPFDKVEDLIQEAGIAFCRALETYEEGHGTKFDSWLVTCVWHRLQDVFREEVERDNRTEWINGHDHEQRKGFDVDAFLSLLGRDARTAVRSALEVDPPATLNEWKPTGYKVKKVIRDLRDRGWDARRVEDAFAEVKEVLK